MKDINKAEPQYKMNELCRVFDVTLSNYYHHPVTTSVATTNVMHLINNISIDSGNTYDKRRIHAELIELGHVIGAHKTPTLMKKLNIKAIRPKKRHY
jgi:putative transposase